MTSCIAYAKGKRVVHYLLVSLTCRLQPKEYLKRMTAFHGYPNHVTVSSTQSIETYQHDAQNDRWAYKP